MRAPVSLARTNGARSRRDARRLVRRLRDAPPEQTAFLLAGARAVIAASLLAAPVRSARMLGADAATAGRVTWLTRMVAARDGVLAGGVLGTRDGAASAPWVAAGAMSDAVDAAVLTDALRRGRLRGARPALAAAGAAVSAVLGAMTAPRLGRR